MSSSNRAPGATVENVMAVPRTLEIIGKALKQARHEAEGATSMLVTPAVFEEAWKLVMEREARGACPCCGGWPIGGGAREGS